MHVRGSRNNVARCPSLSKQRPIACSNFRFFCSAPRATNEASESNGARMLAENIDRGNTRLGEISGAVIAGLSRICMAKQRCLQQFVFSGTVYLFCDLFSDSFTFLYNLQQLRKN